MRLGLIPTPFLGGQSGSMVYARNQAAYLAEASVDVRMITCDCPPIPGVSLLLSPIPLRHPIEEDLTVDPSVYLQAVMSIVQTLLDAHTERPFHIVHAFYSTFTGYAACLFKALTGTPAVISCFGRDVDPGIVAHPTGRRLSVACLPQADLVVASNEAAARHARLLAGLSSHRTIVIPMGVDERVFARTAWTLVTARQRLGWSAQDEIILSVTSSVLPDKRIDLFVDAAIPVLRRRPQAKLVFVGPLYDGGSGLAARIKSTIESSGVAERCCLVGRRSHAEIPLYLAAADLFVDVRAVSNFSSGLMEALAMGTPIIVAPKPSEQIAGPGDHCLLAPEDAAALSDCISRLLGDPDKCQAMRQAAYRWWAKESHQYSMSATTSRLVSSYQSVLFPKKTT